MRIVQLMNRLAVLGMRLGIVFLTIWVASAPAAAAGDSAKGKTIFTKSCSGCHGESGKGDGTASAALNPKPKDLSDKAYNAKLESSYLHDVIAKGGVAVGKAPMMPPFSSQLKPQDIDDVIAYIRSLAK